MLLFSPQETKDIQNKNNVRGGKVTEDWSGRHCLRKDFMHSDPYVKCWAFQVKGDKPTPPTIKGGLSLWSDTTSF